MKVEAMAPMVTDSEEIFGQNNEDGSINPFLQDGYHMGTQMGKHLMIMHANHPSENCKYLILVNTMTGERTKIIF